MRSKEENDANREDKIGGKKIINYNNYLSPSNSLSPSSAVMMNCLTLSVAESYYN